MIIRNSSTLSPKKKMKSRETVSLTTAPNSPKMAPRPVDGTDHVTRESWSYGWGPGAQWDQVK